MLADADSKIVSSYLDFSVPGNAWITSGNFGTAPCQNFLIYGICADGYTKHFYQSIKCGDANVYYLGSAWSGVNGTPSYDIFSIQNAIIGTTISYTCSSVGSAYRGYAIISD